MIIQEPLVSIGSNVLFQGDVSIGYASFVGRECEDGKPLHLGNGVKIGAFCALDEGSCIEDGVEIDDYCAVYSNVCIGRNSKLLYGKKIYKNAIIGEECIVGGNVAERMILEDRVTFMGEVAHSYYNSRLDWDTTDEPSPRIGEGSIVGVNAILVGGIVIGKNCYISAGEILRHDLPDGHVYLKGQIYPVGHFKGLIRTRY